MLYPPPTWDASGFQTSGTQKNRGTLPPSLGNGDLLRPLKDRVGRKSFCDVFNVICQTCFYQNTTSPFKVVIGLPYGTDEKSKTNKQTGIYENG